jgi:hypothetical protein
MYQGIFGQYSQFNLSHAQLWDIEMIMHDKSRNIWPRGD